MYFPEDMNFQYFFFDTYIGYFLQALPIALVVGAIYGIIKYRADKKTPISRKLFSCAFVCYITGLVCLVVGLDLMNIVWYKLLYRMDPGRTIGWFGGEFDFALDFFNNISGETIGNFLMFLPFGILYPLSQKEPVWKKCVIRGLVAVAIVAFAFFGYEMLCVDSSELTMSKMDGSWKELATDDVTIMYQFNKNGEFTEMRTIDDDGTKYGSMCTGTWELSKQGVLGQCISMKYDIESLVVDGHNEETGEVYDESDPTVNEMKQTLYAKYQKENQEVDKYKGMDKVYGLNNLTFSNDTIKQNGISIMVKIGDINR